MVRILVFIAALAGISFLAYTQLSARRTTAASSESPEPSAPKRQLDNVRGAAARIEAQGQERLDRAMDQGRQVEKE
jgi:hypothetical protein